MRVTDAQLLIVSTAATNEEALDELVLLEVHYMVPIEPSELPLRLILASIFKEERLVRVSIQDVLTIVTDANLRLLTRLQVLDKAEHLDVFQLVQLQIDSLDHVHLFVIVDVLQLLDDKFVPEHFMSDALILKVLEHVNLIDLSALAGNIAILLALVNVISE